MYAIRSYYASTLQETAYPGVWLITHFNESDQSYNFV